MSNLHFIQRESNIASIMAAELRGSKEFGFFIDGKNSVLTGKIQQKCPTCPLRTDAICTGMSPMNGKAHILGDPSFKDLAKIEEEAPCLPH